MIRAIYSQGQIRPVEPVPAEWAEGQELEIASNEYRPETAAELKEWLDEAERLANAIPAEDHALFLATMDEIERESKELVRREWGLS